MPPRDIAFGTNMVPWSRLLDLEEREQSSLLAEGNNEALLLGTEIDENGCISNSPKESEWTKGGNDSATPCCHVTRQQFSESLSKSSPLLGNEQQTTTIDFSIPSQPQIHNHTDPPNVDDYLRQFDYALSKIRNKRSLEFAKYLNSNYVSDPSFRLMFLRSDRFDPTLAAQRMVSHFEMKQRLFGEAADILARNVLLSDLSTKEISILKSGFFQRLPSRDAAGRSVYFCAPMLCPDNVTMESVERVKWYVLNSTSSTEDLETQRNGVVVILNNTGVTTSKQLDLLLQACITIQQLGPIPHWCSVFHYCFDSVTLKPFLQDWKVSLDRKAIWNQCRFHFGADEISFELQLSGIQIKEIPIQPDGSISSFEPHLLEWIKEQHQQEQCYEGHAAAVVVGVGRRNNDSIVPRRFDVLFGRGKTNHEHTGNRRASHLVDMYQQEYERAGKYEKTEIADKIVCIIQESFGRFLKFEQGGWTVVAHDVARDKISHMFRQCRMQQRVRSKMDPAPAPTKGKRVSQTTPSDVDRFIQADATTRRKGAEETSRKVRHKRHRTIVAL